MPTTTIHVSDALLSAIDKAAKEVSSSRNRFIVEACQKALNDRRSDWPKGFFNTRLAEGDIELLTQGVSELEHSVLSLRRSRKIPKP